MAHILINIFMVELEQNIIPKLTNDISLWKRYVDDTITAMTRLIAFVTIQSLQLKKKKTYY